MRIFTSKLYLPDEREPAGNAFCILGFIDNVMSKAYEVTHEDERFSKEARAAYQKDATSSDYDHLRAVSQKILDLVNNYDGVIL
jgi:hypothetical protein